ncbi:MAG TPA: DUF1987 domain-containing protein [Bacteroidales bacterium]|nr:DUF1987 domain-containing protein [Bacteroidales bacterium]
MEIINIAATEDTPKVVLDHVNKVFEISGRSLPEDVVVFYQPVMKWLGELQNTPIENMELSIKLEYFNTASSKLILDILLKLEELFQNGTPIKVKWYFLSTDVDMKEAGEEYSEIVGLPFEITEY